MPTIRPTNVDEDVYIAFGNKCRTNHRRIAAVLKDLMQSYIDKGESTFKNF